MGYRLLFAPNAFPYAAFYGLDDWSDNKIQNFFRNIFHDESVYRTELAKNKIQSSRMMVMNI
jgi:hypothetical protein